MRPVQGEKYEPAIAVGLFVAALGVAGAELGAGLWQHATIAKRADWQAAAAALRADFQKEDLIVIAPHWADPLGRLELGDLMPPAMVGRPDARSYRRIFALSIRSTPVSEARGLKLDELRSFGRVQLARYSQKPVLVTYDLIAQAESIQTTGGHVERRMLEIDYRPRYGLSLQVKEAKPTQVLWDKISDTAWQNAELHLWLGLHDYYARKNTHGPADVEVDLDDGTARTALQIGPDDGLRSFVLPLPANSAQPRPLHSVRIRVFAQSAPNHFVGVQGRIERRPK